MKSPKAAVPQAKGTAAVRKNDSLMRGIRIAARGCVEAFYKEKSIKRIVMAIGIVFIAAAFFHISAGKWAVLLLTWTCVLSAEFFNTSLEQALDYASGREFHPLVKTGKDYAAASVFMFSATSWIVTLIIFTSEVF